MKTTVYKDAKHRFVIKSAYGDCLEGAGLIIPDGAHVIIDCCRDIKVGDLVHCTKVAGALSSYIKQVVSIEDDKVIVGTAFLDESKDFTFVAAEIFGVVIEAYSKRTSYRVYGGKR